MQRFGIPTATLLAPCLEYRASAAKRRKRELAEETPVALVYDGSTEAVMMATPADLEDFALGFSLTEGLIESPSEIGELTVLHSEAGIELRMWLAGPSANAYRTRRRRLTGPTGCGLCGIESLAEAIRPARVVGKGRHWQAADVAAAIAMLAEGQTLHRQTHATHAAAFYKHGSGTAITREDVGRHNALDKLGGAIARSGADASQGALVITSRVSVEMVQKAAAIGAPLLIAVSAPTALAVRTAEAANITLIGVARHSDWELYTHPHRVLLE
jgi:FdhD protein